jgi:hypothetical protein
LHWLEDTGHMTPLERSQELAQIMRGWLARIKAGSRASSQRAEPRTLTPPDPT